MDGWALSRVQGIKQNQKPVSLPPIVFDADGLKLLAKIPDWPKLLPAPAILTPHPGEMAVLTGMATDEIQKDRLNVAQNLLRNGDMLSC